MVAVPTTASALRVTLRGFVRTSALLVGLCAAFDGWAEAEEPTPPAKKVREATAEEVPPVVADLDQAAKKKKLEEVLPLLKKLEELKHKDFEKPLHKLLKHADAGVALRAAELLEERTYPESGKALWVASWGQSANDKRSLVRAKVLRALGRIGFALDKKQFDDVEKLWRGLQGTPNRAHAAILVDIAFYAEQVKEKRLARQLAESIDEPVAKDDGPTNPPASWWEEKWNMWNESKAAVHAAIKAMTGQDFDSTDKAKEWIRAHAADGFDW
jgi:hypothetical protein